MNAFQKDLQDVVARHIARAPHKLPALIQALSDDQDTTPAPRRHSFRFSFAAGRFVNLDQGGERTTGDHVAVYDRETDLMWPAAVLGGGKEFVHGAAIQAATDLRLLEYTDWGGPDILDVLTLIDYDRQDPAVDPAHFKGPYSYTWTTRQVKGAASCAFVVGLYCGDVNRGHRDLRCHALAVRAGQPLGFQF